jgi:hypothetical protein
VGYRVDVITDSVSEAVRHAGGLMFDRSRAGWDVVVLTDDPDNSRALAILGARTQGPGQLDDRFHRREREIRTVVTAIGGFGAEGTSAAVPGLEPHAQLLLWGHQVDDELARVLQPVRHRLGAAALSFKTHALHAIGVATTVEECEHFWADPTHGADRTAARSPTAMGG